MQFGVFAQLATSRVNVSPRRLVSPGPDDAQIEELIRLAASAPDHGQIAPWRFVSVLREARPALAASFVKALQERDPHASAEDLAKAAEKAFRAPVLLIGIVRISGEPGPDIPLLERAVSFGAAIQNILLGAHAMGFGAGLTSGKAMASPPMRALCQLHLHEQAVCCVNIGTITNARGPRVDRKRPAEILEVLRAPPL